MLIGPQLLARIGPGEVVRGRRLPSVLRVVIQGADAHEGEPEVREALQHTEQRRLICNPADKYRVPVVARQRHALKQRAELVAQLTLGLKPIRPRSHQSTLAHPRPVLADDRTDHLGETTFPQRSPGRPVDGEDSCSPG
jgi:hypothetical protein